MWLNCRIKKEQMARNENPISCLACISSAKPQKGKLKTEALFLGQIQPLLYRFKPSTNQAA